MGLPEFSGSLGGIQAQLDEQLAEAQRSVQRIEVFTTQAQDSGAFARNEGGEVGVGVDRGGMPFDVEITARAFPLAPEVLSQLIPDVVRQAHCKAVQKYRDLAHSDFGDSATAEQLVSQAHRRLKAYDCDAGKSRLGDSEAGHSESGGVKARASETDTLGGRSGSPTS